MYLSAEQLALANQTIQETFEQTSIAWQAIPKWDTGDPAQTYVRSDIIDTPTFLPLVPLRKKFELTMVQTSAPTPDSLLAEVIKATADLAKDVDLLVLQALYTAASSTQIAILAADTVSDLLAHLITARATVEDSGYRSPSCLVVNTEALIALSDVSTGSSMLEPVLKAAHVNSLHRATTIDSALPVDHKIMLVLGRRQRIAHGGAPDASPGEEPVDLAVSVKPSLEVVGEAANSEIELAVRISFALRIKDATGIVALYQA